MFVEFQPIHNIIWFASFVGIVVAFICIKYRKKSSGYAIGPLSFFLNAFLYNLGLFMYQWDNTPFINLKILEVWSGIVRLHAIFLLIIILIFIPYRGGDP